MIPYQPDLPEPVFDFVVIGSGFGGSLVYAATLIRPDRAFFEAAEWRELADWEAELAQHYDTAERILGVVTSPRLWPADHLLYEIATEMGQEHTFRPTPVAIHFGEPGHYMDHNPAMLATKLSMSARLIGLSSGGVRCLHTTLWWRPACWAPTAG